MTMLRIFLASWTLYCTCLAYPDVHKQMTQDQLQSIFHVEDIDSVPKYELVRLIHQGTSHHQYSRKRRSINNQDEISSIYGHHVKKDLSKSPYYSELKVAAEQNGGNSFSDHSLSDKIKYLDISQIKEHNVSFSAFGEVLNLTLKPTDGLIKDGPQSLRMWTVRSEPNSTQGVEYEEVQQNPGSAEHIGETFQDEDSMAAVLMRRQLQTGDLIMEGSIGHEIVIKPLPHELSPDEDEAHHVVFKREAGSGDQFSDFAFMEPGLFEEDIEEENGGEEHYRERRAARSSRASRSSRRKGRKSRRSSGRSFKNRQRRAAPYQIYPEILVIVDYDGYRLHGGDNVQVKRYFVSFWNGVDLRYRLLKGPRIRISIAGIIISRGRDATPYLERNRVGRDAIDSAAALTDMGKYLFRERRLPVYDIAVAITKYDMCRRRKGGRCTKGTAGFAYVGGACVVNKRLEKVNSVAIIEDTGGFSGIIVAAHEVGHLLGAVHDGSPPPSYLGGPGAEKCRWEDGYIMSDLRHTERGFRWSPCTVQSFHHFLNGDTATCLHNAPHEDQALGRALPGTLLSLDAQCRRDRGTYACFKDDRVCAQLFCFDSLTGYCVAYRPAAEGSSCGNGAHCLDGRCVQQHSNSVASYSHHNNHAYRPGFRSDEDDDLDESTTNYTSTITTSTITTSTLSQSSHFDNFYDYNVDNYPTTSTEKEHISLIQNSFDNPSNDISTTTTTTSTTAHPETTISINPLYYGIQYNKNTEKLVINGISSTTGTTTKKPFDLHNLLHKKKNKSHINYINNNNNNNNHNNNNNNSPYSLTTISDRTSSTSPSATTEKDDDDDRDGNDTTTQRSYILGGRSTSRSPFLEKYLKKFTTTRSSIQFNFDNIAQYLRRSTQSPPSYASNILGDNTNNSPVNVSITE